MTKRSLGPSFAASVALLFLAALALFGAERPSLVVVVSVDQMRADYLDRFGPYFSKDGFNRFLQRGAVFTQARHRHAYAETAPGHAAIGTGLDPRHNGVLSNRSFDPATGRSPQVVEDPFVESIPKPDSPQGAAVSASPVRLDQASLGDRLKEHFPGARVVGVSLKDRAAIFMAGRKADAAVWFEAKAGRFVTSTYYKPRPSLLGFNRGPLQKFLQNPVHKRWDLSGAIPPDDLQKITFDPPELSGFKDSFGKLGVQFPHENIDSAEAITYTPYGNDLILEYARFVIRDFALGRQPSGAPDLFFVGISSTDYYGHKYGPQSREVADGMVRLDRSLQGFFRWLDAYLGKRSVLIFLTADHGVTPIPEVARAKALQDGQSAPADAFGRCDMHNPRGKKTVAEAGTDRLEIERALARELHYALDETKSNAEEAAIAWFEDGFLYLNRPVLKRRGIDLERAKAALRDAARARPGVASAYTNTEIGDGLPTEDPVSLAVERSFRADRAGAVYAILRPGWIWFYERAAGTTHGQPNEDDVHVPLLAWGKAVSAGRYDTLVSPLAITKTVGKLFGFEIGEPDVEALAPVLQESSAARKQERKAVSR
jgi:predicted AlkP superfamily pyrophosphatase or phosphodiesterase